MRHSASSNSQFSLWLRLVSTVPFRHTHTCLHILVQLYILATIAFDYWLVTPSPEGTRARSLTSPGWRNWRWRHWFPWRRQVSPMSAPHRRTRCPPSTRRRRRRVGREAPPTGRWLALVGATSRFSWTGGSGLPAMLLSGAESRRRAYTTGGGGPRILAMRASRNCWMRVSRKRWNTLTNLKW